jgi:hypothetical protein
MRSQDIVILSPYRLENSCLASGLVSCPVSIRECDDGGAHQGKAIGYCTIASFKGLEADIVLLVDIDDLRDPKGLLSVYVGASRPRTLLHVFLNESQRRAYEDLAFKYGESQRALNS